MTSPLVVGNLYEHACKPYTNTKKIKNKSTGEYKEYENVSYYPLKYKDIDGYEWRNPAEYLPLPFDLVQVKTERRTLPGWHDGNRWRVRTIHSDESVVEWRKKQDEV